MVKENSNGFLIWVVLIVALVALILGAVALNKANMTGNAFWDNWFKQEAKAQENVQENIGAQDNMKNYIAVYDENGKLAYEFKNGQFTYGEAENDLMQNLGESNPIFVSSSANNQIIGDIFGYLVCKNTCNLLFDGCFVPPASYEYCEGQWMTCVAGCMSNLMGSAGSGSIN